MVPNMMLNGVVRWEFVGSHHYPMIAARQARHPLSITRNRSGAGTLLSSQLHPTGQLTPATKESPCTKVSSKKFDKIKAKPKAGWTIEDIEAACRQLDMTCTPPTRGDHYKVSSPHIAAIHTIPAKRPIKLPYIKGFLKLGELHLQAVREGMEASNGQ